MKFQRTSLWVGLLGLVWFFGMIVLYYVSHKPFTAELALSLAQNLWRMVAALLLVTLGGGLGRRLMGELELGPLVNLSLQAALGLGILAIGVLVVGSLLGLPRWLLWLAVPLLLGWLRRQVLDWCAQWRGLAAIWRASSSFGRWIGAFLGILFLSSLLIALAPPVTFDALMYHLVMPNAYLQQGRITYLPWIVMTGMPQNTEMLYTWVMALGGSSAALVLGWLFSLLAVVGLLGYLELRFGQNAAWVGTAALMGGYTLAASPAWGYVDWLGLYFGLGALVCLDLWRQQGGRKPLLLTGLFAGLALGTKYPAGVLGLVGLGVLGWHAWRRRERYLPAVGWYALAGGLTALPWLVKNWLSTGNPLYPFLIPAGAMNAVRMHVYQSLPPWGSWLDLLLLPVRATYLGIDGAAGYSVSIGPLLLGFAGLAWIGRANLDERQQAALANAVSLSLLGLLVWAIGNQVSGFLIQTRFYFALFPAFATLAAAGYLGLSQLSLPQVRLGRIVSALVLFVLGLNVIQSGLSLLHSGAPLVAAGIKSEESYLTDNLGWFQPAMQAVRDLPPSSKTLLLFETRSLYCRPGCFPDEILDRWKRSWLEYHNADAVLQAWKQEGFTKILFYRKGAEFMRETRDEHYDEADWQALDQFLAKLPAPVDFGGIYALYNIQD
jgi:hypothetical protein